ncbi:MAG: hypothetical protein LBS51_00435 [Oscillospiraceae bacterium]|nr:hypothetical protein [Oscillospiraceae bacterium]
MRLYNATRYVAGRKSLSIDIPAEYASADTGNIPNWSSQESVYLFAPDTGFTFAAVSGDTVWSL